MISVGYGLQAGNKPLGIWPLPLQECLASLKRYRKEYPDCEIVTVYAGSIVDVQPAPPTGPVQGSGSIERKAA